MLSTPRSRVLFVDDDPDACEMLSEILKLSGIKSQSAHSAEEAWRLLCTQRFDLYVLDAWLPDLDGFEFCRRIRAVDSSTPILFYSGAAYDSDRQKGIGAGANAYLVKPQVDGLVEAVSGLIAASKKTAVIPHSSAIENLMGANRRAEFLDASALRTATYS